MKKPAVSLEELKQRLSEVEAALERHHASSLQSDNLAGEIGGIRSRSPKAKNARWERYSRDAAKTVALVKQRDSLQNRIAYLQSGRAEAKAAALASAKERVLASVVGDTVVDAIFGTVTVVRVNRKGLTIEGTDTKYREARPWHMIVDNVSVLKRGAIKT